MSFDIIMENQKCGEKAKLRYMDKSISKSIGENIETRFDTSNYELDRLLPKGKN